MDWLRWKATELSSLASDSPITVERTYRWHSMCYPIFSQMRERFYDDDGRSLKLESFEQIHDIAWTVWFGDCGKFEKNQVTLNTHVWKEEGSLVIKEYFELLDYKAEVCKERRYFRVRLDEPSSIDFLRYASHKMPNFMRKTLPERVIVQSPE